METFRCHYAPPPVDLPELRLQGIGLHERMGPGSVNRPTGIDTFLIVTMYTAGMNRSPKGTVPLPAGSSIVWKPRTPHDFGNPDGNWDHSWILVGGTFVTEQVEALDIPCGSPVKVPVAAEFEHMLRAMYREVATQPQPDADYIRNHLHNFLIVLGRNCHQGKADTHIPPEYLDVRDFIERHYMQSLSLDQLAAKVRRSVPRFAARYQEIFGVSPIEYSLRLRMQEAQYLLQNHNLTISEIADRLGYCSIQHFSRQFHKRFGTSPSRMRTLR